MSKIGDRVGAILGQDKNEVHFLGYGVYEGDEVPEGAIGFLAEMLVEIKRTNPKIRLDNGKVVWGCECWWGGEEKIKKMLADAEKQGASVVELDIDQVRVDFGAQGE